MFETVIPILENANGRLYRVESAPTDPFAAICLYAIDPVNGSRRAKNLHTELSNYCIEYDINFQRGILTLSSFFPPEDSASVLDAIQACLLSHTQPRCASDKTPEEIFRNALLTSEATEDSGALVIAVSENCAQLDSAIRLVHSWRNRSGQFSAVPVAVRAKLESHKSDLPCPPIVRWQMACPAPARNTMLYRPASLIASHLSSIDGPVCSIFRRTLSSAYEVSCQIKPELGIGWLSCSMIMRSDSNLNPVTVVSDEVLRIRNDALPETRIDALVERMLTRIARSLADNRGRCMNVISSVLYDLPLTHHMGIVDGLKQVKAADIRNAAQEIDVNRALSIFTPFGRIKDENATV
ncbi:hypothetical protein CHUV2995_02299 [Corynebacterium diphtheriae subsp. lausannense]|nr:hypothetical protein CHUV2995_02299 [Corynebacterium diphtheriae subsp. lausannense]STC67511.1 Uncharacterised protein [Corynebacterium diphtheriae]